MRAWLAAGAAAAAVVVAVSAGAVAAAPAPCGGIAQISDVVGDGHHDNTDVTAAWLAEAGGRLQVVVQLKQAVWAPAHDDSDAAGFAFLFDVAGATRYVRAEAPRSGPVRYDFGSWSSGGGFVSAGATSGEAVAGSAGTVTIDVPVATGAVAGATLTRSFVLTYDGVEAGVPHWVDRAPGGVTPAGSEFGADFVVGSCAPVLVPPPGTVPGGEVPVAPVVTTAVGLVAPSSLRGGGAARVSGRVAPVRAGVKVALTVSPQGRRAVVRTITTAADGSFSSTVAISRRTRLRAVADGIASQTLTVGVRSTVRLTLRRLRGGGAVVSGRVRPALPGRVLLLRTTAYAPTASTTTTDGGAFRLRLKQLRSGRYQAVFIPRGTLAERSTSNTGVIR